MDALQAALSSPAFGAIASLDAVRSRMRELAPVMPSAVDRAIACGFESDRLGYAFAAGYAAALSALAPALSDGSRLLALAASEDGGAHPRAIATRLHTANGARVVDGEKAFVTLGRQADAMLVIASVGAGDDGRNRLRVALVERDAPGVTFSAIPTTPFTPEIEHARARFASTPVTALLDGDGYDRYLKPFRTVEDAHVIAAALAYVCGVARRFAFGGVAVSELAALLSSLRDLSARDPSSPAVHVALGGTLTLARALLERIDPMWESAPPDIRERWQRDRAILGVASRARAQRLESAFRALAGT